MDLPCDLKASKLSRTLVLLLMLLQALASYAVIGRHGSSSPLPVGGTTVVTGMTPHHSSEITGFLQLDAAGHLANGDAAGDLVLPMTHHMKPPPASVDQTIATPPDADGNPYNMPVWAVNTPPPKAPKVSK
mmetsp:Transcript_4347/g.8691  ORF Transcript_4347/g.8691 Transcript_4347/m.8691 type:complete len:131 (+) Transcript_4347:2-394(+)